MAKVIVRNEKNAQQSTVPVSTFRRNLVDDIFDACERTELIASATHQGRKYSRTQIAVADSDSITSGVSANGTTYARVHIATIINGAPFEGTVGFFGRDADALLEMASRIAQGQAVPVNCEGEVNVVMQIAYYTTFTAAGGRFLNLKDIKPAQMFEDGHYGNVNEAQAVFPQW